jgi:hypothetical protein
MSVLSDVEREAMEAACGDFRENRATPGLGSSHTAYFFAGWLACREREARAVDELRQAAGVVLEQALNATPALDRLNAVLAALDREGWQE